MEGRIGSVQVFVLPRYFNASKQISMLAIRPRSKMLRLVSACHQEKWVSSRRAEREGDPLIDTFAYTNTPLLRTSRLDLRTKYPKRDFYFRNNVGLSDNSQFARYSPTSEMSELDSCLSKAMAMAMGMG